MFKIKLYKKNTSNSSNRYEIYPGIGRYHGKYFTFYTGYGKIWELFYHPTCEKYSVSVINEKDRLTYSYCGDPYYDANKIDNIINFNTWDIVDTLEDALKNLEDYKIKL